jgi:hypothetical protein
MKIEYCYLTKRERDYWDTAEHFTGKNNMKKFIKAMRREFAQYEIGDIRKNMVVNTMRGLFAYSLGTDTFYELKTF